MTGKFKVAKSGTYKIKFRTTGNQLNPNPVIYDIIAIPDRPPTARFVQPDQPTVKVPANVKVDLVMTGTDDHGVKDATLHVSWATRSSSPRTCSRASEPQPEFKATETLDLAKLTRRSRVDKLTYWLTVRDNKEPASNQFETARQVIEVGRAGLAAGEEEARGQAAQGPPAAQPECPEQPRAARNQVEPQENPQARDDQNLKDGGKVRPATREQAG